MANLFIVATPIGNLKDITLRAIETLRAVDFIICEDTRVSSKLLTHYGIHKPLVSYFQHSKLSRIDEIIDRLGRGESAALITDAGTPAIADPGGVLVKKVVESLGGGITIEPIPGPSALVAALSIAGLPADSFLFLGFPPHKKGRQSLWKRIAESKDTIVFYESPHRITKSLDELRKHIKSDRRVVVGRELTKMYESVYRGSLGEALEAVTKDPIKGEYVVVVAPA